MPEITITQVQDTIRHESFARAYYEAMIRRSMFIQSGIATAHPLIAELAANAQGDRIFLPFIRRWESSMQPAIDGEEITFDKTRMEQDVAHILRYNTGFAWSDLAVELSKADFATGLAEMFADNNLAYLQRVMLTMRLKAIFENNIEQNGGDLVYDISALPGKAGVLSGETLIMGAQKLGDAKPALQAFGCNSMVETSLNLLGDIGKLDAERGRNAIITTFNGRPLIMDDGIPYDPVTGVAEIYLFARGAIALNPVPRKEPFEAVRMATKSSNGVIARFGTVMHVPGFKWKGPAVSENNATALEAAVADKDNYERVCDVKQCGIVKIRFRLQEEIITPPEPEPEP